MIWIMIMYKKTFAIIAYMYHLLPVFSTHILPHASWIALAAIGGKSKPALVDMAVLHSKTKPGSWAHR